MGSPFRLSDPRCSEGRHRSPDISPSRPEAVRAQSAGCPSDLFESLEAFLLADDLDCADSRLVAVEFMVNGWHDLVTVSAAIYLFAPSIRALLKLAAGQTSLDKSGGSQQTG